MPLLYSKPKSLYGQLAQLKLRFLSMRFPMTLKRRYALSCLFVAGSLLGMASTAIAVRDDLLPNTVQTLTNTPGNILPGSTAAMQPTQPAMSEASESTVRLVLNLGKRRVYVYQNDQAVSSYPVAIGKPGWETPLGDFKVLSMEMNPTFKSFKSGQIIPPGPDNPLGVRWIGIWTDGKTQLGFHGTNQPELIGQAVSHGCIRMYNRDVVRLYAQVKPGTPVKVVP
jgi:lipoprotein-anchoring transpeptidase ErfK/SrfK